MPYKETLGLALQMNDLISINLIIMLYC